MAAALTCRVAAIDLSCHDHSVLPQLEAVEAFSRMVDHVGGDSGRESSLVQIIVLVGALPVHPLRLKPVVP